MPESIESGYEDESKRPQPEIIPLHYFVKDEFMLSRTVSGLTDKQIDDEVESMKERLSSLLQQREVRVDSKVPIDSIRLRQFDKDEPGPTLIVLNVRLEETNMDDEAFLEWLAELEKTEQGDVSPNWYTTPSLPGIGGGLALPPQPVVSNNPAPGFPPFTLPPTMAAVPTTGSVQVFLVDTYREVDALGTDTMNPLSPTKNIREWLSDQNYPLSPHYKPSPGVSDGIQKALKKVDPKLKIVKMGGMSVPDHGLFVAGIISSMTNDVNITALEGLTPDGVGNMWTFLACMEAVNDFVLKDKITPVVINCSLTVYLPVDKEQIELEMRAFGKPLYGSLTRTLYRVMISKMFQWSSAVAKSFPTSVIFIAAAGNDGTDARRYGIGVVGPRYPAHFDRVIGVAALDKQKNRAEYSNRADAVDKGLPPPPPPIVDFGDPDINDLHVRGFATLGDVTSLYMSLLPSNTARVLGLAAWSGTSFSSAVVTGILARLLQADISGKSASARLFAALKTMRGTNPPQTSTGAYHIDVQQ